MKTTVKLHSSAKSAIKDADSRPMKAIWIDQNTEMLAVGDVEDLPTKLMADSRLHCDWTEISREELEEELA